MTSIAPESLPGKLVLADGRVFMGRGFGARRTIVGEVVFNTAMTGYQEIVSDPSYTGQIVCLTTAEVGNVGANDEDQESDAHGAVGLIVRSLSPMASSWRSRRSLNEELVRRDMPGISELDTRALTRHLRECGAVVGALSTEDRDPDELLRLAREAPAMEGQGLAAGVGTETAYAWDRPSWGNLAPPPVDLHVVAYDFGIKQNILRCLRDQGIRTTVVPPRTRSAEALALAPDGVLLGNGPGDPAALGSIVEEIRALLQARPRLPVFGICLGHQLLCLALGGRTFKMKFGHHGANHPVRCEDSREVEITSQNHGFAAQLDSLEDGTILTHVNLFDGTVAGLRLRDRPVRAVQYHPEASPGPHDSAHLFALFAADMRRARADRQHPR